MSNLATTKIIEALQASLARADASFDGDLDSAENILSIPAKSLRQAAVLVLITTAYGAPEIILTKRLGGMRHHPGQIAFPGGKVDAGDRDHWQAALREAHEEIGLPLGHKVDRIGIMATHQTITGFQVTPCVAITQAPFQMTAQPTEVSDIFRVPLRFLSNPRHFQIQSRAWQGVKRSYFAVPYGPWYIWGATARILYSIAEGIHDSGA